MSLIRNYWFSVPFILIVIYCALPFLINGYTYPPADDAKRLDELLHPLQWHGYMGHLPALFIGMSLYYYSTPILIFIGLSVIYKGYAKYLPILAWAFLFIVTTSVLDALSAASFIELINFFLIGIFVYILFDYKKYKYGMIAACVLPIFHTLSSGVFLLGLIAIGFIKKDVKWVLYLIPAFITLYLTGEFLNSSVNHIIDFNLSSYFGFQTDGIPEIDKSLKGYDRPFYNGESTFGLGIIEINTSLGTLRQLGSYPISFAEFISHRIGVAYLSFIMFSSLMLGMAFYAGWRPKIDYKILLFGIIPLIVLPAFTVGYININSDRFVKFFVYSLIIFSMFSVPIYVGYLKSKGVTIATIIMLSTVIITMAIYRIPLWVSFGV